MVVETFLPYIRDDFPASLGQGRPPELLITASFNILCQAEDVFIWDGGRWFCSGVKCPATGPLLALGGKEATDQDQTTTGASSDRVT